MTGKSSKATSVANTSKAKASPKASAADTNNGGDNETNQRRVIEVDEEMYYSLQDIQSFVKRIYSMSMLFDNGYLIISELLSYEHRYNRLLTVLYYSLESNNPDVADFKYRLQEIIESELSCDSYEGQTKFTKTIVGLVGFVNYISQQIEELYNESQD